VPTFYTDQNVSAAVARALRARRLDAVSTDERGNKGAGDQRQLLIATAERRAVVTHDGRDFRLLHRAWREWSVAWGVAARYRHGSIVVVPQGGQGDREMPAGRVADLVTELARAYDNLTGRFFVWSWRDGWRESG